MNAQEVVDKYFKDYTNVSLEEYKEGAINLTYHLKVEKNGEIKDYKLQKMNKIFNVSLMEDIDFITKQLAQNSIATPEVVRTLDGKLFEKDGASWWRVLTYLPGKVFFNIQSKEQAGEAGKLVGRFHSALLGSTYKFKFKLPNYRGIDFYIKDLKRLLQENKNTAKYNDLHQLAEGIISSYEELSRKINTPAILPFGNLKISNVLPERIIHGDLKISNILFDETGTKALALIDIDTFMYGTIPVELGDALRSWSLPEGEDADKVEFSKEIYESALSGYESVAQFLTKEERSAIPYGVKLLALEEATRFTIDAFNENYFTLDAPKYTNLFEQNKKRAQNQFEFYKEFSKIFT